MRSLHIAYLFLLSPFFALSQTCTTVEFTMETQQWGEEISWNVTDAFGNIVHSSTPYTSNSTFSDTACLYDGCYTLNMFDDFGDGWNGGVLYVFYDNLLVSYFLSSGNSGQGTFGINTTDSCSTVGSFIWGCTDPSAINYDPTATIDDGSCEYQNDTIYGCTDPAATNYNPWAMVDDGSCEYAVSCDPSQTPADAYVCVFSNGNEVGFEVTDQFGDTIYSQMGYDNFEIDNFDLCLDSGVCYTAHLYNLAGPFGWYNGYFWINAYGGQLVTGTLAPGQAQASFQFSVDGTCGDIWGCTDPQASNYDPAATIDDGSCVYAAANDLCADALPLQEGTIQIDNTGAVLNEGVWGDCWNSGSGEGEQSSLWFTFTTPATPAHITIESSGDGTYTLTDTQFGLFDSCGGTMIACDGNSGNGLFSMLDFDCGDLDTNTTYILVVDGYFGDAGTCLLTYTVSDQCGDAIEGCTDPAAVNYDPTATVDDGSCYYVVDSCASNQVLINFTAGSWASEVSFEILQDSTVIFSTAGVVFENQAEYYFLVCLEDGCYTINMYDTFGDGWNGGQLSVSLDGVWVFQDLTLPGGSAGSYSFGINDPSCGDVDIYGCTDPAAINYNPIATVDDGTCVYDSTGTDCYAYFELVDIDETNDVVYLVNLSSSAPGTAYYWEFGDGGSSTEQHPQYQYAEGGSYTICLTVFDSLNCISTYCDSVYYDPQGFTGGGGEVTAGSSNGWWINVIPEGTTGLEELTSLDHFAIYPVPATQLLTVDLASLKAESVQISVLDLSGRLVHREVVNVGPDGARTNLDVSYFSNGFYLIEALSSSSRSVKRFEIQR